MFSMEDLTDFTSCKKESEVVTMSLNIMCAICNEFYKNTDFVYSTTMCGHLFHHQCLFRWLNRSKTCPQCRRSCHRNRVHRVYLNFGERTELDDIEDDDVSSKFLLWTLVEHLDRVPSGAIKSGTDPEGNDAYVARVFVAEDLLPANFVPKKEVAYTPWNCIAHSIKDNIELLVNCDCSWVAACDGDVPENAIVTGYTEEGEDLYTGRSEYEGVILGGKVHRSHGVLYMPYKGEEVNTKEYEVLVREIKEKQQQQQEEQQQQQEEQQQQQDEQQQQQESN